MTRPPTPLRPFPGSFLVSCTFPHTFMYLSGLLTSVAYIPVAFTLPCLFSLKLLSGTQLTALEYTLSTWCVWGVGVCGGWEGEG